MREKGRHPHSALTPKAVQSYRGNGHTQRKADGGGLYLLVAPSGSKSWVLRTVVRGKRTDIGLGGFPVVSLADAREEARRLRRLARSGGDPLGELRHERRPVPTFEAATRQVHATLSVGFRNEKHGKQWLASLSQVFKAFGAKRVDAVTPADVLAALEPVWVAKPETSSRVLQRMRTVFAWSKAQGHCSGDNPTDGVTKVLPKHRGPAVHHAALPYREVSAFVHALRAFDAAEVVKLAFEFTILNAVRTAETLGATWQEVDGRSGTWTIPGNRMKSGVEHRVPMSRRSVEILKKAKTLSSGSPYVFRGQTAQKPLSNMVFLMTLRRMKRTDITTHGFRSSFRDWAAERTNAPRAVCESALAHSLRDKTEAAYNRTDLFDRRRELMDSWAAFATRKPAKVVPIRA